MKLTRLKELARKNEDVEQIKVLDYLERATDDNKKSAIEYLKDRSNTKQLEDKEREESGIDNLSLISKKLEYCQFLASHGKELLADIEFDSKWYKDVVPTDDTGIAIFGRRYRSQIGVVFILKNPMGQVFVNAMSATGVPTKDLEAVGIFAQKAENTFVDYEKKRELYERKIN